MKTRRGYSMIEILLVFAVLAIIGAVGYGTLRATVTTASDKAGMSLIETVSTAVDAYHQSRTIWVSEPGELEELVEGASFTSGAVEGIGTVSVGAYGEEGVVLATLSPTGDCLTRVVTTTLWSDGSYVPGSTRPCSATGATE